MDLSKLEKKELEKIIFESGFKCPQGLTNKKLRKEAARSLLEKSALEIEKSLREKLDADKLLDSFEKLQKYYYLYVPRYLSNVELSFSFIFLKAEILEATEYSRDSKIKALRNKLLNSFEKRPRRRLF